MLKRLYSDLFAGRHLKSALATLRTLERKLPSPEARFAVPFVFKGRGHFRSMKAIQTPEEIETLYRRVLGLAPKRVLEIGTLRGGTLYLFCRAAMPDATIVTVDLEGGQFGGGYPECRIPFYEAFPGPKQNLHLVRGDSHSPETLGKVKEALGPEPIDFMFIDADHTEEGVTADFFQYGPLVRPGGLLAMHDIRPNPDDPYTRVFRLWDRLKRDYETEEIVIRNRKGRELGIGILTVPPEGIGVGRKSP